MKQSMTAANMRGFRDVLEICQEDSEQNFVGRFEALLEKKDLNERLKEIFQPKEKGFNTLCHGDVWFNNILFR